MTQYGSPELFRRDWQLSEAQRSARVGSWDWDLRADRVVVSDEMWRLFQVVPEDERWGFERCLEQIHPEDREIVLAHVQHSIGTGATFAVDARVILADGRERVAAFLGHTVLGPDGRPTRLIGTAQDITDRRGAAAALQWSVRVEQSLTRLSKRLAEGDGVAGGDALGILGEALGADRVYLIQSRMEGDHPVVIRADEWCAAGVTPGRRQERARPQGSESWAAQQLRDGGRLLIPRLGDLPPDAREMREMLESQGVASAAAVAVPDPRQGLSGVIAVEYGAGHVAGEEDIRVLRTAGEFLVTHFARERAEREIASRDAILEAVGFTAERLLRTADWRSGIDDSLARIGAAAGASRAYLFQNTLGPDGEVQVSQRNEWVAEGVEPQIANPDLQSVRLGDLGVRHWQDALAGNQPVHQFACELTGVGRELLDSQDVQSMLLIPIFVGDVWWGFLGFDDCAAEREWSHAERDVLMTAGRIIGAGIQRRRAEQALRESELRFKQLADNIPEVFFMTTADVSEVLYLSPSFEQVWGRSLEDAYANPKLFIESIVPDDLPAVLADMHSSQVGSAPATRQLDYRIARPDGTVRWIRNRIFQIPDESGRPYRVAGVCTDFTDQKQLEEDLRRANRVEAIGHLAAGIAHEINTPIQYVGDNLCFLNQSVAEVKTVLEAYESLLNESLAGEVKRERLEEIARLVQAADLGYLLQEAPRASAQALDGVHRVAEIVRAMKEFSHPGSGIKVPTDLNQAIRSTTTVARNEWKYVAEVVIDLDESLPPVLCLPGELNQAFLNLLVNASHAIADRQQREGHEEPGTIIIGTAHVGDWVEVRVSDTGTGIPAAIMGRIFDPFFTTKEVGRGTGQGLTFVHTIVVEKHGGTISVDTEPGVGTTFTLRIPAPAGASPLEVAA